MLRSLGILATALVSLAACADAPSETDEGTGGGGGKADGSTVTIEFAADHSETADGQLVAGLPVRIDYDLARMTDCRGSTNGSDVWGVTGFASFDGGAATTFAVSRLDGGKTVPVVAELAVPAGATTVALWFQVSNRWGCVAYDSNDNANYTFELEQRANTAVLAFDADFSETFSTVHAGDQVVVHFDPARLADCEGSTGGHVAWGVTGYWQVDAGTVHTLRVARTEGSTLVAADPEITVPRGSDLALWFDATNIWGCHAYDSNLGGNYHVEIE